MTAASQLRIGVQRSTSAPTFFVPDLAVYVGGTLHTDMQVVATRLTVYGGIKNLHAVVATPTATSGPWGLTFSNVPDTVLPGQTQFFGTMTYFTGVFTTVFALVDAVGNINPEPGSTAPDAPVGGYVHFNGSWI